MSQKLKSCPFCGEKPDVQPSNPQTQGNCWGRVKCKNKECPTHGRLWIDDDIETNDDRGSEKYKQRAIELWNNRF